MTTKQIAILAGLVTAALVICGVAGTLLLTPVPSAATLPPTPTWPPTWTPTSTPDGSTGSICTSFWFWFAIIAFVVFVGMRTFVEYRIERARRKAILAHCDEWGEKFCQAVIDKDVLIGMTEEMVRLAWGRPDKIDMREVTERGEKFRWIYGTPRKDAKYVWFTYGKVSKIKL
jgi:hypothetical protein